MLRETQKFSDLTVNQKEAISLLGMGTFLEYFDLMLYVHMAVLLNEIFFPQYDPFTNSLISAFAFCSTYILRPFGALLFGYIGDHIGRKATVIITTAMMSLSCIIMANLPTYAQIGITASWIITFCRMIQGLSTMGEVTGANIYITETTKPPIQYPAVALMSICGVIGGTCALGIASITTSYDFNWRLAFWIGAGIAIIGAVARTRLRESKDYADAKLRIKRVFEKTKQDFKTLANNPIWNEKVKLKTALSLFFIECSWPVCFYFVFIYCGNLLKTNFGLSAKEVIEQNFNVAMFQLIYWILLAYLSYKFHPLKILKAKLFIFTFFVPFCPLLIELAYMPLHIMFIQIFIISFGFQGTPAMPVFYKHIPIFKRFTYTTFAYAFSRALVHIANAFGIVYFTHLMGHWGILVIFIPTLIAFTYALYHFSAIDQEDLDHYHKVLAH